LSTPQHFSMPSKQTGEKITTPEKAQEKDSDSISNGSSSISAVETVYEVSNDQVNVHRELMAVVVPPSPPMQVTHSVCIRRHQHF
jgi:hypothetical protein